MNKSHTNHNDWTKNYSMGIQDTGITTPVEYNLFSNPDPPYILTAASLQGKNVAPVNYNPSSMVYTQGNLNQVLLASSTNTCDPGCVKEANKSDPRVFQVKPLYLFCFQEKENYLLLNSLIPYH